MTISKTGSFYAFFGIVAQILYFPEQARINGLKTQLTEIEDKIENYYNYTDATNPGDDSPRDLSYWLGSDSSVILRSPNCSGSDSSAIPGSNTTNPNQKEKNYPKGSDSSVMVEIVGIEPMTS